jgi:hypothetical protein
METERSEGLERKSHWDMVADSETDRQDIRVLRKEFDGDDFDAEEDYTISPGHGMILRQNDKPVGYILFAVDEYVDEGSRKQVLFVDDMHILKRYRNAGVVNKLLLFLKEYAKQNACTHIGLTPGSDAMEEITRRLTGTTGPVLLPIDRLDVSMLTGRI